MCSSKRACICPLFYFNGSTKESAEREFQTGEIRQVALKISLCYCKKICKQPGFPYWATAEEMRCS